MQIIFIPRDKSKDVLNFTLEQIHSEELEAIKKDLAAIDPEYEIKEKNFGEGADWIMLLAILNGITTVFLVGDKINTGIDGWIKIGKRIRNVFSKSDRVYVDMDAAKILGINYIAKDIKIESVKVLVESEIPIKDLSKMLHDRNSKDFIAKPYSVYFVTYEINDHILITLGIRSDGKINEHYNFNRNDLLPF